MCARQFCWKSCPSLKFPSDAKTKHVADKATFVTFHRRQLDNLRACTLFSHCVMISALLGHRCWDNRGWRWNDCLQQNFRKTETTFVALFTFSISPTAAAAGVAQLASRCAWCCSVSVTMRSFECHRRPRDKKLSDDWRSNINKTLNCYHSSVTSEAYTKCQVLFLHAAAAGFRDAGADVHLRVELRRRPEY